MRPDANQRTILPAQRHVWRWCTSMIGLVVASGCAASLPPEGLDADGHMHAHCTVCVKEGDLACVDVLVEDDTPHTTYAGKEWYFCGKSCRRKFLEHPDTYVK